VVLKNTDLVLMYCIVGYVLRTPVKKQYKPKTNLVAQVFLCWINTVQYIDVFLPLRRLFKLQF